MRALVQRVHWAQVEVGGQVVGRIEQGLLVYLGLAAADDKCLAEWMAAKISSLRLFQDAQGKINLSVQDVRGGVLAISNFTLLADARKGRRPTFEAAAGAEQARPIHQHFVDLLTTLCGQVAAGVFGAEMIVSSAAAGPVNVVIDAQNTAASREPPKGP